VKELTLNEVLEIAGGLPDQAALDELAYGMPEAASTAAAEASRGKPPPAFIERYEGGQT
jgi:hypothetical protein